MSKAIVSLAVVAFLASGSVADAASPSPAKMRQMGLYGATVVSDAAAMDVRGFGYSGGNRYSKKDSGTYAKVSGHSYVSRRNPVGEYASAYNSYDAKGNKNAIGFSISGIVDPGPIHIGGEDVQGTQSLTDHVGGGVTLYTIFAGGVSGAAVDIHHGFRRQL